MNPDRKPVFGLIEHDRSRGVFVGTIIGFRHLGFECGSVGEVEQKLRKAVEEMIASESLVLETEFAAVVCLGAGALSVADLPQ